MSALWALGGAAAGYGLDLGQTAFGAHLANKAANKAWRRQLHMAKHQIQYRMQDMREGGLNPILAAKGALGGGSSSAPMATVPGATGSGAKGITAAKELALYRSQKGLIDAQGRNQDANAAKAEAERNRAIDAAIRERFSSMALWEQAKKTASERELVEAQLPGARAIAEFESAYPWAAVGKAYVGDLINTARGLSDTIRIPSDPGTGGRGSGSGTIIPRPPQKNAPGSPSVPRPPIFERKKRK
mgnify:CR=1 FL=1